MTFPPRLRRDVLLRAVLTWAGLRVVLVFLRLPVYGAATAVGVVALVAAAVVLDGRASRERLLLANLGVSSARVAATAVWPPALLELATGAALRVAGALLPVGAATLPGTPAASPPAALLAALGGGWL